MKRFLSFGLVAIVMFVFGVVYAQETGGAGSQDDPLVSLTYLEQRLGSITERLGIVENKANGIKTDSSGNASGSTDKFVVVNVSKGKKLECEEGTEVILRAGIATAVASKQGGLSCVTTGEDLAQGKDVPKNNLLIIPRTDGRGIVATEDCVVMVKGKYTIK